MIFSFYKNDRSCTHFYFRNVRCWRFQVTLPCYHLCTLLIVIRHNANPRIHILPPKPAPHSKPIDFLQFHKHPTFSECFSLIPSFSIFHLLHSISLIPPFHGGPSLSAAFPSSSYSIPWKQGLQQHQIETHFYSKNQWLVGVSLLLLSSSFHLFLCILYTDVDFC